jgi:YVTN family beta-propeller protein
MARILVLAMGAALAMVLGVGPSRAQNAYVTNSDDGTVTVIATGTNTVAGSPITVGNGPGGVAVTPDGSQVYVSNNDTNTVSVINTATNAVSTITVGTAGTEGPAGIAVTPDGKTVYVAVANELPSPPDAGTGTVVVIDTASNTVTTSIVGFVFPYGVAVTPDGAHIYVTDESAETVSVIATSTNTVTDTIADGSFGELTGVAMTPDGSKIYVASNNGEGGGIVFVIDTSTNTVVGSPIAVGFEPFGVAVTPDGAHVYVANESDNTVSVIATSTNTVTDTIVDASFSNPAGVAVTPDGTKVYVANESGGDGGTVSVIDTSTSMVTAVITVGNAPVAFGNFIGPPTLTVSETGNGQVTSSPVGINCSPTSTQCALGFAGGTTVTLTATANAGSMFTGWGGGVCSGTAPCVIDLTNDTPVSATFTVIPSFLLSVTDAGTGSGTVSSNPSGINCPGACSASYQSGTQVVLTATPAPGSMFSGWSGAGCPATGTCTVTMNAAESVTATFSPIPPVTLTVVEAGTGAGLVTSKPAGINCSSTSNQCAAPFAAGSQVTLSASASVGSSFSGWSGSGCSGTGTCQVTLSADTTVTATFKQKPTTNMLSVALTGGGSGTVTSTPSGINCGPTCTASFDTGTQITLSAAAASGSTFAGWSGGGCSGTNGCTLTLNADTIVTASFVVTSANLTLVAAVLPTSRSVEIGTPGTAFATMINAGPADAATCTIAPATGIPASFVFQTTDPITNQLTGTANTPADIAAGQAGTFVIALTPTAAFAPTNVAFTFTCANAPSPAASIIGVDTLNLSASATPVPDIVALAASADPGYVDIPGATGTGVFAVATVNLGIDATIAVTANTGMANLPITLTLCQTAPTGVICLAPPAGTVTLDIPPNATPTFGVFVAGNAFVANMPAVNRVFVTFTDSGGVLRGETSVAVRTH